MMSKYNSRLVALFLAIVMVLNVFPVAVIAQDGPGPSNTILNYGLPENPKTSQTLYNLAKIGNDWYRLKTTEIVAVNIDEYIKKMGKNPSTGNSLVVSPDDYEPISSYDFSDGIDLKGKHYEYVTAEYASEHSNSDELIYKNYFTAVPEDTTKIIVAVYNKIGGMSGSTPRYLIDGYSYPDDNATNSYHRNYVITKHDAQIRKYSVRFVKEDGTALTTQTIEDGKKPSYNGTPKKDQTPEETFTFIGWYDDTDVTKKVYKLSELPAVHSDVTYVAAYTSETRKYTITWKHEDGTRIDQTQVAYGGKPTHTTPDKLNPDERYTYEFKGWNPEITEDTQVTKNAEYKAVFSSTPKLIQDQPLYYMLKTAGPGSDGKYYRLRKGTITAKAVTLAEVGKTLPTGDYVAPAEYPFNKDIILTVNGTEYEYSSEEKSGEYEAYYTTAFDRVVRKLQINEDSAWFDTEAGWLDNAKSTYDEDALDNDVDAYHADYIATLHPGTKQYTITFDTDGGTEIQPITQVTGSVVRAPKPPTKPGYTFGGWKTEDTEDAQVPERMPKGGAELIAKWEPSGDTKYTVNYYYEKYGAGYEKKLTKEYYGVTGKKVSVTDEQKNEANDGFYFDTDNSNNVLEGTIAGDGSLELKLYYKSKKEPLYTLITYKDPKTNKEKWFGIEYQSAVNIINSRFVKFEYIAQKSEYDIPEFDFVRAELTLDINGVEYWPKGSPKAESGDYPYYEWNLRRIQKVNHTDASNGLLNGAERNWVGMDMILGLSTTYGNSQTNKMKEDGWNITPGDDGLPYKRGFWHRDYDITLHDAQPKPAMTLTAEGYSGTYDGATHKVKVTAPDGSMIKYSVDGGEWTDEVPSITDAGEVKVKIQATHSDYKTGTAEVTLKLAKAELTVTTGSDSRAYNGDPLTKSEADINGLVNKETATVTATGTITNVGVETNTYRIDWGTANAENYKITENLGTLTITTATMPLTVTGYEGTYDGTTYSVAVDAPAGSTIEYSVDGGVTWTTNVPSITDAGEVKVQVRVTNGNYEDATAETKLALAKAPVTITTGGGERMYNGATLTNAEAGITGLVNGETATVTATGTILNAGSATNTYGIAWGTAKSENYVITENLGTLEVTPRMVTLTSASDSKAYDGGALTKNTQADVTVGGDGFVAGEGAVYTITGRQTTVGSSDNLFVYTLNPGTLARNYSITPSYGTLTVLEAENEEPAGGGLPGGGLPGTDLPGGGTGTENTPEGGNTPGTTGGRGVQNYTLTITYQTSDGTVLNTFERTYANGQQYEVRTPAVAGYTVDIDTVFGTINGENVTRTVTYTPAVYTLTVYVQSITNGAIVGEPIVRSLVAGEAYSVAIPEVDGYTLLSGSVEGTMPASNREITVFAIPAGTNPGGAPRVIQIEDYGTPLGIAETILGSGEIIE